MARPITAIQITAPEGVTIQNIAETVSAPAPAGSSHDCTPEQPETPVVATTKRPLWRIAMGLILGTKSTFASLFRQNGRTTFRGPYELILLKAALSAGQWPPAGRQLAARLKHRNAPTPMPPSRIG